MYRSAEVRWFFQDKLPVDVCDWFESGGGIRNEPERTDEYLVLPGCATTSVKFRDGRFEVKALTQGPVPVNYGDSVSGLRDAWVKWSSASLDAEEFHRNMVRPDDNWISVSKSRRLRLISLETGDPVDVAPDCGWLSAGCQVELTSVRARTMPWWSLSFEAFGDPATLADNLDMAACFVLADEPPCRLNAASSFSYPAWLVGLDEST